MSDPSYPLRQPPFPPPLGTPFGMVRRNAFGRAPIQPGLLPMNLLRSHLYPGDPQAVAEGIAEFNENIENGESVPMLPQRMAFSWRKMRADGTPTDPSGGNKPVAASAASLAAAVAWGGQVAKMSSEVVVTPRNEDEARAMYETFKLLSAGQVMPAGQQVAREVNGEGVVGAFPTQTELLDAYGDAMEEVQRNAVTRRATYLAKALREVGMSAQKTLSFLRPR